MSIAQELLDLIIQNFRPTLSSESAEARTYLEAWTLLTESPHLVGYVIELDIYHPMDPMADREIGCLQRVLTTLGRAQRFRLKEVRWDLFDPHLSSDLVAFVLRQNLRALSIEGFVLIQAAVVQRFITSVPTLSFNYGGFDHAVDPVPDVPQPAHAGLNTSSKYIEAQRLSVVPAVGMGLIHAVASTLEHLFLALEEGHHSRSVRPFPSLPCLQSLSTDIYFFAFTGSWLIETVPGVLASNSDTIKEVIIASSHGNPLDNLYIPVLNTLDHLIISHSASPRIRWQLAQWREFSEGDFTEIKGFIQQLVVERRPLRGGAWCMDDDAALRSAILTSICYHKISGTKPEAMPHYQCSAAYRAPPAASAPRPISTRSLGIFELTAVCFRSRAISALMHPASASRLIMMRSLGIFKFDAEDGEKLV
ncbi:hypothetical protein DFH09DRAFT_1338158 [Mycena vulgaris]|nr:hypothetical protein DFH09DRAFT_1338158 [Mycena vulgaris]